MKACFRQYGSKGEFTTRIMNSEAGTRYTGLHRRLGYGMGTACCVECCVYNSLLCTVAPRSGAWRRKSRASVAFVSNEKRFNYGFVACMSETYISG